MKNEYMIENEVAVMTITRKGGRVVQTMFDVEDLNKVKSAPGTWYSRHDKKLDKFYIQHTTSRTLGKRRHILLHRFIMDTPNEMVTDHINGDTLDNRKINLRNVMQSENAQNITVLPKNNTSGVMNVSWHKGQGKWVAKITKNRKRINLGYFDCIIKAKKAVSSAREKHMPYSQEALKNKVGDL